MRRASEPPSETVSEPPNGPSTEPSDAAHVVDSRVSAPELAPASAPESPNEISAAGDASSGSGAHVAQSKRPRNVAATLAPLIALAGWVVPGSGHLLLGRWGRAAGFFVAVGGLAVTGFALRGELFAPRSPDPFGTLGFLADAASGIFYFLARFLEAAGPNISRAAGEYGTRFLAAAGVVNIIALFDAFEIAIGRRS